MKPLIGWRVLILLALFLGASSPAHATGETGAQFLRIGVGAKACAMGEAFVGLADDPSAIHWNPAGLTQAESIKITGAHSSWLLDMSHQWFAVVVPMSFGSLAASACYSSSGEIPKVEDFEVTGEYSAYDVSGAVAYGHRLGEMLSVGFSVKYIKMTIEEEEASGISGDVGLLLRVGQDGGFRCGFSALNVGRAIGFLEIDDPLPIDLRGGASYESGPLTVAVALDQPRDDDLRWNLGGQFVAGSILAIRAGYNSAVSYSAGLGLNWRNVLVEYAYVPYENIDDTHRISITLEL